jgi:YggT family protein
VAVVVAIIALADWAVRTRRLNPFGPVARFCRRFVDPLMAPVERRIVRAGGQPSSAPWWTLVFVVVGGILLIWVLDFLQGVLASLLFGLQSPAGIAWLLVGWVFGLLRLAIIVRVVASWFGMSPYSKWIRWSVVSTEWFLAPLGRVIPNFGPIDVTPIVALILLSVLQRVIGA